MRTIAPVELFSSLWAGGSLARIYRGYRHKSHKMTNNKNENESQSTLLGKPSFQKSAVFLNIVQKAFDPPLLFEHLSYFAGGVF